MTQFGLQIRGIAEGFQAAKESAQRGRVIAGGLAGNLAGGVVPPENAEALATEGPALLASIDELKVELQVYAVALRDLHAALSRLTKGAG